MSTGCNCDCGCSATAFGVPENTANRPGLPALAYRIGTHAAFVEAMIARLSSQDFPALARLTTRDPADPSIALLDSWALVADVLTFYQERIANEGYLRTAIERRSVLELARLIGYKLRPGVAASVYLAYTLSEDLSKTPPLPTETVIPAGSRCQSVPSGPGELPQSFETSDDLDARSLWNVLGPRVTRPQLFTLYDGSNLGPPLDFATDITTRTEVYFNGVATNLKPGDPLLFVFGPNPGQQVLRSVQAVEVQGDEKRTEVILQPTSIPPVVISGVNLTIVGFLQGIYSDATTVFAGSNISARIAALLRRPSDSSPDVPLGLLDFFDLQTNDAQAFVQAMVAQTQAAIAQTQELHDLAVKRNFTRLEPWLIQVSKIFDALLQLLVRMPVSHSTESDAQTRLGIDAINANPFAKLTTLVSSLAVPPSRQPANSLRLSRSSGRAFSLQSDLPSRLLGAFAPSAAPNLYQAWTNLDITAGSTAVGAVRIKTGLFPGTYQGLPTSTNPLNADGSANKNAFIATFGNPPLIIPDWQDMYVPVSANAPTALQQIALDGVYDKIVSGSWIMIDRPNWTYSDGPNTAKLEGRKQTFHKVARVTPAAMKTNDAGFSAKVTQLVIDPPWLGDLESDGTLVYYLAQPGVLSGTVVYTQTETLDLAEEPIDADVEGDTIELDGTYEGLESGRWIIVSGERTDIPDVTGVTASELVMISGVEQGSRIASCAPWPSALFPTPPFTTKYFVTEPNKYGDRLVIGPVTQPLPASLPLPAFANQQYCDPVELAPGLWVNAYVPTADERNGILTAFAGFLVDANGNPIRQEHLNPENMLAWRVSVNPRTIHTLLTLANALAYSYDVTTVTIYGNVVKATHGETRNEVLGNGDGSQSFQQFKLKQKPLTFVSASNPAGIDSTLAVYINNVKWQETDTLAALGPKDRDYISQTANDDTTAVIFGNGKQGARLPTGAGNVTAIYRNGIGQPGNVKAGQISLLQTRPLNVKAVINPLRASGGADHDSRDQARRNAPLAVLALDRLVSVQDYADFARTFAGIGKSSSTRISDGQRDLVHLTIAGAGDIPIDVTSDLYGNLVLALQQNGDPYQPFEIAVRGLRLLVISVNVKILPDYLWEPVSSSVRAALLNAFSFDNRNLGQPVFQSEVISVMQAVEGVAYVDLDILDSVAEGVTAAQLAGLAANLKLRQCIPASLARPNPAPANYPVDAILPAELAYLSPDLPDMLILNEVKS